MELHTVAAHMSNHVREIDTLSSNRDQLISQIKSLTELQTAFESRIRDQSNQITMQISQVGVKS
jgi:hypothetical protein